MNNEWNRYFEKRMKIIEILNKYKDKNGISQITPVELERELKINRTNLNKLISEINTEEPIITRYENNYIVSVSDWLQINYYKKMMTVIAKILENKKELFENENEIAEKYNIKRTELQRIKTIVKAYLYEKISQFQKNQEEE